MKHLYWMVDGVLAGRCGPCSEPWDLAQLKQSGIGAVVSLCEVAGDLSVFADAGLEHLYLPMARNVPPTDADLQIAADIMPRALGWIAERELRGVPVLVHCSLGNDRTGLLLASYLMMQGAAPVHAVSQVRSYRDAAFTAEGWDQFVYDVLYSIQS